MTSDKEFFFSLFPEDGHSTCKYENCATKTVRHSVMCARHHFEMVMKKPCPFTYEDLEISRKKMRDRTFRELTADSARYSILEIGKHVSLMLIVALIFIPISWMRRDPLFEGDQMAHAILGSIFYMCIAICGVIIQTRSAMTVKRLSNYRAMMIIGASVIGACVGFAVTNSLQWISPVVETGMTRVKICGAILGSVIGLSVGLGVHKASSRLF